jgi:hypothetical protein
MREYDINLEINNGRKIGIFQARSTGPVYVLFFDENGNEEKELTEIIRPGDFVTMINWYQHQRRIGNTALQF